VRAGFCETPAFVTLESLGVRSLAHLRKVAASPNQPGREDDHLHDYTPDPVIQGSSVSHWDQSAFPNQLMEPNINSDLKLAVDVPADLTRSQLRDVGWYPDKDLDLRADDGIDQCLGSNLDPTVVIGSEDTAVPNTFFDSGCTIRDLVDKCEAGAPNHGGFISCVANLGQALIEAGIISEAQKDAIQRAAAHKK
jgi:hypothetical protein